MNKKELILWFSQVSNVDVPLVGGKNASLGEMYQQLKSKGVNVPNGFAVTAAAYQLFIDEAGIRQQIKDALNGLNKDNTRDLETRGQKIRNLIMSSAFPQALNDKVAEAYKQMEKEYNEGVDVAIRSSATAEDLPDASFAGQQETFLNIRGITDVLYYCKCCMASLFTNRAISYREDKGFDHFAVSLSIGVQKMVRSDEATSGVIFTLDTESGFRDVVLVTGSWGLGENIVQGTVGPDEFFVFKPTLKQGKDSIIMKKLGNKEMRMIYAQQGTKPVKNIHTPQEDRERFCCSNEEVLQLAKWACVIEDHYTQKNGKPTPMDIEWAKDGFTNEMFIVQARPETVHSQNNANTIKTYKLNGNGKVLTSGSSVGSLIGSGTAHIIKNIPEMHSFKDGEVLVTVMTDPDWEPVLKRASAVVTNRGGRTCHAAIISRELGIPCIVGCGNATDAVKTGQKVTVDCSSGEVGRVIEGEVPFEVQEVKLGELPVLRTKVALNIANPENALAQSFLPVSGVGLARMEFIISNHIKCHPLALKHPEKVSVEAREKIQQLIKGYKNGEEYFVDRLSQGIGTIAAAFYPKPVILRFSDFKTDEYADLLGGEGFEPKEDNPMIGWRGASRYYDPHYREGFQLECMAVKKVREEFGLVNLQVMIPFCRTIQEAKKVVAELASNGLKQHENGLQVIGMCEVPSNVILADKFLDILDGYSIGSNDLTQLTLGVDRNSEIVSHIFDERDEAVKTMISQVIQIAKKKGKYIGICGQAPSDFPEFAQFLVEEGIESISLNPDTVIPTILKLAETEKLLGVL